MKWWSYKFNALVKNSHLPLVKSGQFQKVKNELNPRKLKYLSKISIIVILELFCGCLICWIIWRYATKDDGKGNDGNTGSEIYHLEKPIDLGGHIKSMNTGECRYVELDGRVWNVKKTENDKFSWTELKNGFKE